MVGLWAAARSAARQAPRYATATSARQRLGHARPFSVGAGNDEVNGALLAAHAGAKYEEASRLLDKFRRCESDAFAVIKVGGDVVEYELEELVETCGKLRENGLMPVVIHGGGPQMNDELKRVGVQPEYIRGSRITDKDTLEVAQRIFTSLNQRIVDAFKSDKHGNIPATGFAQGVFDAEVAQPELGFVGQVTKVQDEAVRDSLRQGSIPVLTSLGTSAEGQALNINADVAARELVLSLKPMRVVFVSAKGGWLDDNTGEVVDTIDLASDYEALASLNYEGRQGTLLKLNEIKDILDNVPEDSAVAITSAKNILKELFTDKGAGTLFRKGRAVEKSDDGKYTYNDRHGTELATALVKSLPGLGKVPPVIESFTAAPESDNHDRAVWAALRKDHSSLAWAWSAHETNASDNNILNKAPSEADMVLRVGATNVAFYNSGHDLKGWNEDTARRYAKSINMDKTPRLPETPVQPVSFANPVYKIGLLGARGYVGQEFVKLLCAHPHFELTVASSRALNGQRVLDCFDLPASASQSGVDENLKFCTLEAGNLADDPVAKEVDVWVLALPNGLAPPFVQPLQDMNPDAVLIDLGADYRFDKDWTYGLPERHGARDAIRKTQRIANPGCYATGAQAALMPIMQPMQGSKLRLKAGTVPSVFGVSGYSGAGTTPSDKNDPVVLADNLLPYAPVNHMHERECTRHLDGSIAFMPHVASWFQGIHLTTTVHLETPMDAAAILEEFQTYYKDEPLVKVSAAAPVVKDNMLQHDVRVGGFTIDPETGRLVIISTIDNLLKGAASQAVQNLNLALGLDEYAGIPK
mmetsp:Transcript_11281/g.20852  ORF Transcript_11281/g.20852 Transcript_11281/m.20852 type:complete len:812 (+) Transcript_11281:163-2598(+)